LSSWNGQCNRAFLSGFNP